MINLILLSLAFGILWFIVDAWKRNLFLWSVIWGCALVYELYIWSLL